MRMLRRSGVVFGSEIMKKAKSRSAPDCICLSGTAQGSPRYTARAKRIPMKVERKDSATSARLARLSTRAASHANKNANHARLPHWAGDIHAAPESSMTTMAKLVARGLRADPLHHQYTNKDHRNSHQTLIKAQGPQTVDQEQR